jgi:hypothetical protein
MSAYDRFLAKAKELGAELLYLPLGGAVGTALADLSGNGHAGTLKNGAALSTPGLIVGGAKAVLDGTNDYISTGWSIPAGVWSVAGQLQRPSDATKDVIFASDDGAYSFYCLAEEDTLVLELKDGPTLSWPEVIPGAGKFMWALRADPAAGTADLFVDRRAQVNRSERVLEAFAVENPDLFIGRAGDTYSLYFDWGERNYWKADLVSETANPGGFALNQLNSQSHVVPLLSQEATKTHTTRTGTWTALIVNVAAYGGGYYYSTTAGSTMTWVSPEPTTRIGWRGPTAVNGGLIRPTIDGSNAACNLLPTAEELVAKGRYNKSILKANGGTLNPGDRVLDTYQGKTNFDTLIALAEGLAEEVHTVVLEATGYQNNAGNSNRAYVSGLCWGSETTDLTAEGVLQGLVSQLSDINSAWEYANQLQPPWSAVATEIATVAKGQTVFTGITGGTFATTDAGSTVVLKGLGAAGADFVTTIASRQGPASITLTAGPPNAGVAVKLARRIFIGNIHGYEVQDSFTVKVDGEVQAIASGEIFPAAGEITVIRVSHALHPDCGATQLFTATTVYLLNSDGLEVDPTITWKQACTLSAAYAMLPLNGATLTDHGVNFDTVQQSGTFDAPQFFEGLSDHYYKRAKGATAWMWTSTDRYGAVMHISDPTEYTDAWANSSPTFLQIEDREGKISKIYMSRLNGTTSEVVAAAQVWPSAQARYLLGYFPDGADEALADL